MSIEALNLHLNALYLHNKTGDILSINQWDGGAVPLFHYAWCKSGYAYRYRHDLPSSLRQALREKFQEQDLGRDCFSGPLHATEYQTLVSQQFTIKNIWHGLAYWRKTPVSLSGQRTRLIEPGDEHLLREDLEPWQPDLEHREPFVIAHNTDQAISVCASVRITTEAHEAGVETMHAYRRGGYGDAAVRRWTNEVLERGAIPIYSTSRDNVASQRLANRVGYESIGYDFFIT